VLLEAVVEREQACKIGRVRDERSPDWSEGLVGSGLLGRVLGTFLLVGHGADVWLQVLLVSRQVAVARLLRVYILMDVWWCLSVSGVEEGHPAL